MSKVAKATIGLIIVTLLSKILGFGRELVLGAIYGATSYSDIYITAMNIPGILFASVGTALMTTFIPLYFENDNLGGEEDALKFTNNTFNIVLLLGFILSLIGFVFAEYIVKMFAIGFEGENLNIAVKFTRIMILGGIFIGISNIMTALLQIKGKFNISGLIGVPYNIVIIISIILSFKINIYLLPLGTLLALISQFIFQYYFMYKYGYRYRFTFNIADKYVKKMIWLLGPVFIGVAVNQINAIIDRSLASTLVEGSISALNYSNKLNAFIMALFITTLSSVIYPILSKLSSEKCREQFVESIVKSVNSVILLIIPITVGAIVFSRPIVTLLFQRGAFDERATNMTSIALVFYSIGMIGFALRDILGKIFYSLQDTKTPMLNGTMSMVINIILNLTLVKFMGHAGIAFATSISSIICILLLFRNLKKKIEYYGQDKIIKTTIKSLIAAILMGVVTYFIYNILDKILGVGFTQDIIALFVSIGTGAIIYGVLIIILKVEEVSMITNMVKRKISA